ncbi:MAG: resolvase domain-containing protein [Parcubacteria group bacterium Gr01-1014_29]|nr:MAG: resolvase domain-containing protein [Parcubacteria group bacterium Gr01-1014_29]
MLPQRGGFCANKAFLWDVRWVNHRAVPLSFMKQETTKIKYFLYARKSSESEDRQVQSIDDQINRLKQLASYLNLDIKKIYTEAKSAKKPNNRPIFDEMIQRIENGEASGILCWQINRLSRNPIDSGKLGWLLQQGILKSIQTIDRQYLPDDNVLLFSVESGMANQYILDLRKNVKRGTESKLQKGWKPNLAPLGYLNDKAEKTITKDPERFNLIRKMWDLMLTGSYTPPKILDIANHEWGFKTRTFNKKGYGGKPLSRSGIYKIFTNIFYAGVIDYYGTQYSGKHEPMITIEEFDRVQMLLGRKGKPRPKHHEFAFTGSIRCGVCDCLYTAETKKKIIKSTDETREYTYYHCTRKTTKIKCNQKKNIPVDDLEMMIEKEIEKYTILPEFLEWALEGLNKKNDTEIEDRTKVYEMRHKNLVETQKELDELTKMRYRQLIDDETFIKEKNTLQSKIAQMKENLRETETRAEKWLELTEKTFSFATYARKAFLMAKGKEGLELKKEILLALGKTPIMKDQKLFIEPNEWFAPIKNDYPALEARYVRLEPQKMLTNKAQKDAFVSLRTQWLPGRDSNPDTMLQRHVSYH